MPAVAEPCTDMYRLHSVLPRCAASAGFRALTCEGLAGSGLQFEKDVKRVLGALYDTESTHIHMREECMHLLPAVYMLHLRVVCISFRSVIASSIMQARTDETLVTQQYISLIMV